MPDSETTVVEQPKQSFADYRSARGATPQEPIPLDDTPLSKSPDKSAKPAADSEPASGQTNVEKRQAEIDRDIASRLERARIAGEKADAEEARLAKVQKPVPRETGAQTEGTAPAALDGTDPKDPRPERPKKPTEADFKDKTWAEYQAAVEKHETEMDGFREKDAEWIARREWRKADQAKQITAKAQAQQTELAKDLEEFETVAKKWAKSEGAEDFDGLLAEVKKRPNLSPETGSVTMYGGEDGARLLYELMSNPDKLEEIEKMPRAIDRLNALYDLKYSLKYAKSPPERKAAQEKPRSAAPAAGTRLHGTGGASQGQPKTFAQYREKRFG